MGSYIKQMQAFQKRLTRLEEQAEALYREAGIHTEEEGTLFGSMAEICRSMAGISTGLEADHYTLLAEEYEQKAEETKKEAEKAAQLILTEKAEEESEQLEITGVFGEDAGRHEAEIRSAKPEIAESSLETAEEGKIGETKMAEGAAANFLSRTYHKIAKQKSWLKKKPKHTMKDVYGMEDLKKYLLSCVKDFEYQELRKTLGMRNMHPFFFYGPPGSGKTYLIEAFANELKTKYDYQYIAVDTKDILDKYVGESEKIVAEIFELAEKKAPCVLFIDEIDGVCRKRSLSNMTEHGATLTTAFLTGYNRIHDSNKDIIFIGATNYPEYVDEAMLNRVELLRLTLPDEEARRGYLENSLKKMGLASRVSTYQMARRTEKYDCRDLDRLLEQIKMILLEQIRAKRIPDSVAVKAVENGEIYIDDLVFERAMQKMVVAPKDEVLARLERWEQEIHADLRVAASYHEMAAFADAGQADEAGSVLSSLLYISEEKFFLQQPEVGIDGRIPVHNPYPFQDTELAYYVGRFRYSPDSPHMRECALQYCRCMEEYSGQLKADTEENRELYRKMQERIRQLCDEFHFQNEGSFAGTGGRDFLRAYDGFITARQGKAVPGFLGTCGICSSCTVINIQKGNRLREEDGIAMFLGAGQCIGGGGTTYVNRRRILDQFGIRLDLDMDDRAVGGMYQCSLENMEEMFRKGCSIIIILKGEDLKKEELAPRRKEALTVFERLRNHAVSSNSDHAVTVAGFRYDAEGRILGIWINDTGGWGESNRIYLDRDRFDAMAANTKGFSTEFAWKREG